MLSSDNTTPSSLPCVFVAEYLCGGGMLDTPVEAIPESLLREGTAMWRALVDDVSGWANVRTPVDPRLTLPPSTSSFPTSASSAAPRVEAVPMQPCAEPWVGWIAAARNCDMALVIIPETDGLLTKGITLLRAAGVTVLAPTGKAIGLTADKWATAKWLHQNDIAHPTTWSLEQRRASQTERHYTCSRPLAAGRIDPVFSDFPASGYLVKPRDGCGAMEIRRYDELEPALASMGTHEITQQFWSGRSASISIIASNDHARVTMLPAVWQHLEAMPHAALRDNMSTSHFVYRGGSGPLASELQLRAQALTARVLQALPGKLAGFVGIDLVLGADANHDAVIEINSRLTTSYIGLRQMTDENLTRRLIGSYDHAATITVPPESIHWNLHSHFETVAAHPSDSSSRSR